MTLHQSPGHDLQGQGPRFPITLSAPRKIVSELEAKGSSVPAPINTLALVDTAATHTCILPMYAQILGLTSLGTVDTLTAAGTTSSGKGILKEIYEVCVTIGSDSFEDLPVLETDTTWLNVGALIGRDILTKAVLVYNGRDNICTLEI